MASDLVLYLMENSDWTRMGDFADGSLMMEHQRSYKPTVIKKTVKCHVQVRSKQNISLRKCF